MRFDIRYRTNFTYDRPVWGSHNELRACPAATDRQRLVTYRLSVEPTARVLSHIDYWGTRVDSFGVRERHERLEVVAEATVETSPSPLTSSAPTLDALQRGEFRDLYAEYLERTRHTDWDDTLAAEARSCIDAFGPDVVGVVLGIHRKVRNALRYDRDATDIGVPVTEVWQGGAGVCQDYAHAAVALCRAIGIPARYVSGYLFSADDDSIEETDADIVEVQTHAWFEAAIPGSGWMALDPTNGRDVGSHHVVIGHGRDYDDVAPFWGAHGGSAAVSLEAHVEMRRGELTTGLVPVVGGSSHTGPSGPGGSAPLRLSGPDPSVRPATSLRQAHQPDRKLADLRQQQQQQQ